jgi:hypothetical protein
MIGDSVEVKVLGLRAGQIKLGIEAPKDLKVHREGPDNPAAVNAASIRGRAP